jgi:hypothetical protein
VQRGPEVGGAHPLDDGDPLRVLVGGLGDLVPDDPAERVLGTVERQEVCCAGLCL